MSQRTWSSLRSLLRCTHHHQGATVRALSTRSPSMLARTKQQPKQQEHISWISPIAAATAAGAWMTAAALEQGNPPEGSNRVFSSSHKTLLEEAAADCTDDDNDNLTTLLNWSGTHAVQVETAHLYEPETIAEVEALVALCHERGQAMRPLGSALSPNAIAFSSAGMMSLVNLDQIVQVNTGGSNEPPSVTVQAGARVSQVVEALRPYNLTLPNLASISEQQMGGFVQVGAHGTGRCIAPVDHYVTSLKMVTPGRGTVTLTKEDGELFHLAKVGLGCLGVVVEITMTCIPAHRLVEHTFVLTRAEAVQQLDDLLKKHKHVRYMWIPYTDAVVVVTNDPEDECESVPTTTSTNTYTEEEQFQPLRQLLVELSKDSAEPMTMESLQGVGFGELRDQLLAYDPLNIDHVKRCNEAEAEFWRRSEGYQVKPNDELLQFDCGGQQWVLEMCFPTGTQEKNNGNDMKFMSDLLEAVEREEIPAPPPIEQRWSASSSSYMSPAYGPPDGLHSWVGIIHYLPSSDKEAQRRHITEAFTGRYCDLMRRVGAPYHATSHWAKLEKPVSLWKLVDLKILLEHRFPLAKFNQARAVLDPKNLLANELINQVLGTPPSHR